jgi:hypothetical protein
MLSHWVHVPTWASLAVIVVAVGVSVVVSLVLTRGAEPPAVVAELEGSAAAGEPEGPGASTEPEGPAATTEPEESAAETSHRG